MISYQLPYPSSGAQPLLLLSKDKMHLAPNLGFHGFLVPLSAVSSLSDKKPVNLPIVSHSMPSLHRQRNNNVPDAELQKAASKREIKNENYDLPRSL